MLNKNGIKQELKKMEQETGLSVSEYQIGAGSGLTMLGLRSETRDVDTVVSKYAWNKLIKRGYTPKKDGGVDIISVGKVDIHHPHPQWGWDREIIEGVPTHSAKALLKQKKMMNRPKDQLDIQKLKEYLGKKSNKYLEKIPKS